MAPFWFIPYAIATGNTFISKPSELVPLTMEAITELIDQLNLPPGVFNLVNGDKEAGAALIDNPDVDGVSFVGKSSTCHIVAKQCVSKGKRYQAMGSAKNHLIVMPDYVHMDALIRNMSTSCYGCAGQRCMASSVIVAIGDEMYKKVCNRFIEDSNNFIVANPLDPKVEDEPMLMGPVITAQSKQFILDTIESGVKEGATLALDGRDVKVPGCEKGYFVGPTVFTDVKPGMTIYNTEIFAPVVCIMKADTLDDAIDMINKHEFTNACSIYTQNGHYARKFKLAVQTGMVGVNVGIPAPVPFVPFGGMNNSMICDIKMQGKSAIRFYTHDKVIVERYWDEE
jgi:malonate-semialdehyde dehydrogenase (acetylating)/methylmalonate-semialdehyde dehydrogenase